MDVTRYLNLFFLFSSFVAAIQLDDSVLESGRNGSDVVLLSVAYIERAVIFAQDNGLLRRIAYVETRDGFSTLTSGNRGGIWAVGEEQFTNTQTSNDSDVVRKREQLMIVFNLDWEAVQWSDLNKPFYSALAARLVLFSASQSIPNDTDLMAQAQFWRDHYHAKGSVKDFIIAMKHLEGKNTAIYVHDIPLDCDIHLNCIICIGNIGTGSMYEQKCQNV